MTRRGDTDCLFKYRTINQTAAKHSEKTILDFRNLFFVLTR